MSFQDAAKTWNQRYAQAQGLLFGAEPNAWLRDHVDVWPKGARILSVADGEGRNSVWLARQGYSVHAFDISDVGVQKARELASSAGVDVKFDVASCEDYAWPEAAFDGVAAIFIQFADPELRALIFRRIVAALKPGGLLLLQGYTPRQLAYKTGGPGIASHLYTPEQLGRELAALEFVELREYDADVAEGSGHHGRSALIGLVARKRPESSF